MGIGKGQLLASPGLPVSHPHNPDLTWRDIAFEPPGLLCHFLL